VSLRKNDGRIVLEMAYETWQKLEEAAEKAKSEESACEVRSECIQGGNEP
jgi:hypothetical protein